MTSSAISIDGLVKTYGKVRALDGLDLEVPHGSVVGVIGPNGAGKSTTMKTLVDLARPTAGTVRVLGHEPRTGGPALRRRLGYLPGEFTLDARVTGRQILRYFCRLGAPGAVDAIDPLADRLGLDPDRPIRQLSKGNKQKVGLVQAFVHRPEVLVLDEPTSGLDPLVQREFLALVREAREAGTTVFLSSHVLGEIDEVADSAAVLRRGRIVFSDSVAGLRERAGNRLRAVLRGDIGADDLARALPAASLQVTASTDGTHEVTGTVPGSVPAAAVLAFLNIHEILDFAFHPRDFEESVLEMYEDHPTPGTEDRS
ncbi:ABC transporter ATP-binding protein [Brevibacterium litoralis]|uniref:ABC transporter ATP-binding protein n=1 Tax=Brevibacterium litoralis TaxID=3138935 RepID=UPI0032EFE136